MPAINRRDSYRADWTAIAKSRFRERALRPIARAVRDSARCGAGRAPGRAARGPAAACPTCRYPGGRSFALLPGRLLPFAGSGRSGFLAGSDHAFTL